jgi:hypothetical protein
VLISLEILLFLSVILSAGDAGFASPEPKDPYRHLHSHFVILSAGGAAPPEPKDPYRPPSSSLCHPERADASPESQKELSS